MTVTQTPNPLWLPSETSSRHPTWCTDLSWLPPETSRHPTWCTDPGWVLKLQQLGRIIMNNANVDLELSDMIKEFLPNQGRKTISNCTIPHTEDYAWGGITSLKAEYPLPLITSSGQDSVGTIWGGSSKSGTPNSSTASTACSTSNDGCIELQSQLS